MNKDRLATILEGVAALPGIVLIVFNSIGVLTVSAGMASLSIVLAVLSGLTIGSIAMEFRKSS
jgi:hypothetical protein